TRIATLHSGSHHLVRSLWLDLIRNITTYSKWHSQPAGLLHLLSVDKGFTHCQRIDAASIHIIKVHSARDSPHFPISREAVNFSQIAIVENLRRKIARALRRDNDALTVCSYFTENVTKHGAKIVAYP